MSIQYQKPKSVNFKVSYSSVFDILQLIYPKLLKYR